MKILKVLKFNSLLICLFVLFSLLTNGEAVAGTTYYVSPTGNDSNSGYASAPFKTIQKAADIVNPGDTVIVKDGTYTDTNSDNHVVLMKRSGTTSQWITFKSENKWGAVLDGNDNTTSYCWNFGTTNYIAVEGFEIKGCQYTGVHSNGGGSNLKIYQNNIHDIGRLCTTSAYGQTGILLGGGTSDVIVDSNIIHHVGRLPNCGLYWQSNDHGIYISSCSNATVANNIFYNNEAGWSVHVYGSTEGNNIKIINNTFAFPNPYRDGHILLGKIINGLTIQNNISYNPTTTFVYIYYVYGSSTWNIYNNLVYGASKVVYSVPYSATYNSADNIVGQNPKFVDVANSNFHLQSNSLAIDHGLVFPGRTKDADGNPIVGVPDIGSYEYVGNPVYGDTNPPAAPRLY